MKFYIKMLINSLPQIKNDYIFKLCENTVITPQKFDFCGVKGI